MDEKPKVIIIKRVKKGHGGHHGGSWKVAYADFVTAMMAFFLVMWLLSMVSPEKRAVMAQYFKNFSLFEEGGKSFMQEGGFNPLTQTGGQEYYETGEDSPSGASGEENKGKMASGMLQQLDAVKESVMVEATDLGIRIQVLDREENPIFPAGSPLLTAHGKKAIGLVSGLLKGLPNKIIVEGHTDASQTNNEQMTNWELSSLRACNARRELTANGVSEERVVKVVGFANKVPLFTSNPDDPRNRRISVLFLYNKKKLANSDPYDWVWKAPPPK